MKATSRASYALIAAALLAVAGGLALRNYKTIQTALYARRLAADDVAPDAAAGAARGLAALDPGRPPERLAPRAQLRFLISTSFVRPPVEAPAGSLDDGALAIR